MPPQQNFDAALHLEDGKLFVGQIPAWVAHDPIGEVVFTTGMTGYPETLTDPSYAGQIICFTYPLIGNYGVFDKSDWESDKIHAAGVIVSESCRDWCHAKGLTSLEEWLHNENVPLLLGVDTRELAKYIRNKGTPLGIISKKSGPIFTSQNEGPLVEKVSCKEPQVYGEGDKTIIAVDCGMKANILRSLAKFPIRIKQVPHDYDYTNEPYDALFLSNGPGDPQECGKTIAILQKALTKEKPIFGICLGTQLLALAAGGSTYKLPFGHRGHNQPCREVSSKKAIITSQNHGYAIDQKSLPSQWSATWTNLNDDSVEGICHNEKPFFAVQFHPEACPGPTDAEGLFKTFYELI